MDRTQPSQDLVQKRLQAAQERADVVVAAAMRELDPIRRSAENADVDGVKSRCDALSERLRELDFPRDRAREFIQVMTALRQLAHIRKVDALLSQAIQAARSGDQDGKAHLLAQSKQHIALAIRYGANEEFRHTVEKRIEVLRGTSEEGTNEEAIRRAEIEAARLRRKPPPPPEAVMRRAIRYVAPSLKVTIGNEVLRTVNWSIRGVLIGEVKALPKLGERLRFEVEMPGLAEGGKVQGRVVRIDDPKGTVAVDFGDINTTVLGIVRYMKDEGVVPVPEF